MISRLIHICIIFLVLCPQAISQGITSEQWINMGQEFMQIDRYKDALNAFNKSIELDPKSANSWDDKGKVLQKMGRINDSIKAYEKAIELDPGFASACIDKGNALQNMELYNESIKAYNKRISNYHQR